MHGTVDMKGNLGSHCPPSLYNTRDLREPHWESRASGRKELLGKTLMLATLVDKWVIPDEHARPK